jgi:hypothetical protein
VEDDLRKLGVKRWRTKALEREEWASIIKEAKAKIKGRSAIGRRRTYWQAQNHLQYGSRGSDPNDSGLTYHHLYIITSFQIWFDWFNTEWWRNGPLKVSLLWGSGGDCVVKGWGLGMGLTCKKVLLRNLMTNLRLWRETQYGGCYGKDNSTWTLTHGT